MSTLTRFPLRAILGLLLIAAVLVTAMTAATERAAHAEPGNNLAADDPFTSARTQWWRDGHFGMFIHWGSYAQWRGTYKAPDREACHNAEWIFFRCGIPRAEYERMASTFNPSAFDAKAVVQAAKDAGQKYIVITTKHHDGYAMWPTKANRWNIRDTSAFDPTRDVMKELADAAKAAGIKLGFYYSIRDWHDPDAQSAQLSASERQMAPEYQKSGPPDVPKADPTDPAAYERYMARMKTQIRELLTNYGDVAEMWFDGDWDPQWNLHRAEELETFIHDLQPQTIVNDRMSQRTVDGGDFTTPEKVIPPAPEDAKLWESCTTIGDYWGFSDLDTKSPKSAKVLVGNLTGIAASSGNFLLNVSPDPTGTIPTPQRDRLAEVGRWLGTNGRAVYGAGYTGLVKKPSWGTVSRNGNKLYATVHLWPSDGSPLRLDQVVPFPVTAARVLRTGASVPVTAANGAVNLGVTGSEPDPIYTVLELDIVPPAGVAPGDGTGLKAEYWTNTSLTGAPAATRVDTTINHRWGYAGSPAPNVPVDNFSARWTGSIQPRFSEDYRFVEMSDDSARVWIGDTLVIDHGTPHGAALQAGTIRLEAGRHYPIRVEYAEGTGRAVMKLFWSSPSTSQEIVPQSQLRTTAPAPAPTASTAPVNDDAAAVSYAGTRWLVSRGRSYGDHLGDVHATSNNGDAATVSFTGTGIDVVTEKNSDQGLADMYLDGVRVATVDTYAATRSAQQVVYGVRDLTPGPHTLRLVKSSGSFMVVDRFDVFDSAALNDDASAVSYAGTRWLVSRGRSYGDHLGDVHATSNDGDAATVTFTGTGIDVVTEKNSDQGPVTVYLDGVQVTSVDTSATARSVQQVVYGVRNLTPGQHSLRLVKAGGTFMVMDRFDVLTQ